MPIAIEERATERLITGEEFARMNDIELDELVEGRIIKGLPTGHEHGSIEANIASELRSYVRKQSLGKVMSGEVGIYTRRNPDHVRKKLREYFAAEVLSVWVVDPESRTVSVYRSMSEVQEFTQNDVLTADDILPGFSLPVAQIFEA